MGARVVDNALFGGAHLLTEFVVPRVTYTEPEAAFVSKFNTRRKALVAQCDAYTARLGHNDRAVLEVRAGRMKLAPVPLNSNAL